MENDDVNQQMLESLNQSNPYLEANNIETNGNIDLENYTVVTRHNTQYIIANTHIHLALRLERMSKVIRFLCYLDIIVNSIYILNGFLFGLIFLFFSISGLFATRSYKKNYIFGYLVYQYLQFGIKLWIFINCIYITQSSKYRHEFIENNPDVPITDNDPLLITVTGIMAFIQGVIAAYTQNYYMFLPNSQHDRNQLLFIV